MEKWFCIWDHLANPNNGLYIKFGATEHFRFLNDDRSIHIVELETNGVIFHLHETMCDVLEPTNGMICFLSYHLLFIRF
jgi:hypothetical protein